MKTLQEQYNLIKKAGRKDLLFLLNLKWLNKNIQILLAI